MIVAAEKIAEQVRSSPVVASDETSARVKGTTWWQWVLLSSTAVYHVIAASRGAKVVTDFLRGAVPEVWVADRYAAQNGHGLERQICLAHLLRDAQYAIDDGDTVFAPGFKALLKRAVAIGRRRETLQDTTSSNIAPISTAGSTVSSPNRRKTSPPASSSAPCDAIATTCSDSSPDATCPIPIMAASERSAPPSSSEK